MKLYEYKAVDVSDGFKAVKDVDMTGRIITGYAAVFGNKDLGGDIIEPGAFLKTLKERGPKGKNRITFLNQHDTWQPQGKPTTLKEDGTGLYHETPVVNTTLGNDTLKLFDAGILDSFSIGYRTLNESRQGNANHLKELHLYEYSSVTFPMNEQAVYTGTKGLDKDKLERRIKQLEKFCDNTDCTDETIEMLLIHIKQLQQELIEFTGPGEITTPPGNDIKAVKSVLLVESINNYINNF